MMSVRQRPLEFVIVGSFRQENLQHLRNTIGDLAVAGVVVLAPVFTDFHDQGSEFVRLDSDSPQASPRELEQAFMDKIATADGLLVVNHRYNGRAGLSAAAEIAWAAICGVPVHMTNLSVIYDHPSLWWSGDVSTEEREALKHLGWDWNANYDELTIKGWREKANAARPLAPGDPDYAILLGLHDRLLQSLPDIIADQS